ncbi:MAG: beta-ribofuranosylaminobenzene 5'-phosphate synthase [Dehalococcoidales bacterium]|nr:beta-ribofuranosylaminobenzene 5'-phosphate synthase [Dehalococcoidales bacterium]
MDEIRIACPSRLHLGLIDLNGEIGRIDGGTGITLEQPRTVIHAMKSDHLEIECPSDPGVVTRAEEAARAVMERYGFPPARIVIEERPFVHVGVGSGTQLMVGIAKALCHLAGRPVHSAELGSVVNRGGTSGIGVAAIEHGGFILDGGHNFRNGDASNSKSEYSPSAAVRGLMPPPVLARYDFPDWDILVCAPRGEETAGIHEVQIFKIVCPVPIEEVRIICHLILLKMLPAILERDLESFGFALEETQKYGFKKFEFRAQSHNVFQCLKFLKENGGAGVGMSSWGPTLFAFGEDLSDLHEKTRRFLDENMGGTCFITRANNTGMRILD